jgi:hypothetical protein
MNKHIIWLCLILIPALLLAPFSRIHKNENYVSAEASINKSLAITGLTQVNEFQSTNSGPYQVQEFSPKYCDGSILLLPVYRNAEGVHILKHLIANQTKREFKQGIIFKRQIFDQLPQWQFTLFQLKLKLEQWFQIEQKQTPALIFAEQGQCEIANYLISKAVISFSN